MNRLHIGNRLPPDRQRQFLDDARSISGLPLEVIDGPARFEARAVYYGLGDVMIGEVSGAPHSVAYRGGSPASAACLFSVPCMTHGHLDSAIGSVSLVADRLYMLGDRSPWQLVEETVFRHLVLRVPRAALPNLRDHPREHGAVPIDAASTTLIALMKTLVGVREDLDRLSIANRSALGASLCSLLDTALGPVDALTAIPVDALRAREQYHRQRIREHVVAHLGDASLDVESIAQAVGLSPRHVHRLYADEGQPLMRWIWSERLDRCRDELADPDVHAPISAIAYRWGFSDSAHFSRVFRQRFGTNPRAIRDGRTVNATRSI